MLRNLCKLGLEVITHHVEKLVQVRVGRRIHTGLNDGEERVCYYFLKVTDHVFSFVHITEDRK